MLIYLKEHKVVSLIITLFIAVFIFYMSSKSFASGTIGPEWEIKPFLYHFTIFFLLGLFLTISLYKKDNKLMIILSILLAISYGITDELHQFFVPGRESSIFDVLTDTTGILLANVILLISEN
ncbi:MAG: VanZ family protein [Candidatus Pacearchaeota archaeon]